MSIGSKGAWPSLPTNWFDTLETLHLRTQIIGKIRLNRAPWLNHSWSVTLYPSPTGLRISLVPYGTDAFEWSFDFIGHRLDLTTSTGERRTIDLEPVSVATMYGAVMDAMDDVGMPVAIHTTPNEIADAIPFPDEEVHASYDPAHADAWWRAILQAQRVFERFRAGYQGKVSPVHLFRGALDLAVTRFSGRTAPQHPGGMPDFPDDVACEAYSHEVTSVGFWPGSRADADLQCVRLPDPRRLPRVDPCARRGVLARRARGVRPALRGGRHVGRPRRGSPRVLRVDPCGGRRSRRMEPRRTRVRHPPRSRLVAQPTALSGRSMAASLRATTRRPGRPPPDRHECRSDAGALVGCTSL